MRIRYLVEGPSEADLLDRWLPRALPAHSHIVYPHEGKGHLPKRIDLPPNPDHRGLLDQLPAKLRAYGASLDPQTDRVLVLVDADDEDPTDLSGRILDVFDTCVPAPHGRVAIAVEETEAFYLGDPKAIEKAFKTFKKSAYNGYVQDSVCGTWEVFQAVIGWKHESKCRWAQAIGDHLSTATSGGELNRSPSFRAFYQAVKALAGEPWP